MMCLACIVLGLGHKLMSMRQKMQLYAPPKRHKRPQKSRMIKSFNFDNKEGQNKLYCVWHALYWDTD